MSVGATPSLSDFRNQRLTALLDEQAKFQASDKQGSDFFGRSTAISDDGNTAIVGMANEDSAGAAYIFTWSGTSWTQQQKIQASDKQVGDFFGISISISENGNTAIVGAPGEATGGTTNAGTAYIFTWSGTSWTQQQKIQASDKQVGDFFGISISISENGNTAIVGTANEDSAGAAYIFTRSGTTWTQQQKIQASDKQGGDFFGISVSISEDGNTAIVGAANEDSAGAAYIFTRSGTTWTQQQKIQASDKQGGDFFGISVSISEDGNTAIVGAANEDSVSATYIFTRSGNSWT